MTETEINPPSRKPSYPSKKEDIPEILEGYHRKLLHQLRVHDHHVKEGLALELEPLVKALDSATRETDRQLQTLGTFCDQKLKQIEDLTSVTEVNMHVWEMAKKSLTVRLWAILLTINLLVAGVVSTLSFRWHDQLEKREHSQAAKWKVFKEEIYPQIRVSFQTLIDDRINSSIEE